MANLIKTFEVNKKFDKNLKSSVLQALNITNPFKSRNPSYDEILIYIEKNLAISSEPPTSEKPPTSEQPQVQSDESDPEESNYLTISPAKSEPEPKPVEPVPVEKKERLNIVPYHPEPKFKFKLNLPENKQQEDKILEKIKQYFIETTQNQLSQNVPPNKEKYFNILKILCIDSLFYVHHGRSIKKRPQRKKKPMANY